MKNTVFFAVVLDLCILLSACQNDSRAFDDGERYTVKLNLTGEFDVDVEQTPLTRAGESTDAYAVHIYYDREGDGAADDYYAYGLFDNVADMTITMLSNHKYRVYCTLVKDAYNTLYFGQAFNNSYSGYAYPFQTNASNSTIVGNRFIIGSDVHFTGMSSGSAHIKSTTSPSTTNATPNASINRFYGYSSLYDPVPNGTIDIYLKRVVYGADFVISGVQSGSVSVTCGDFFSYSGGNRGSSPHIYTFTNVSSGYNGIAQVNTVTIDYTSSRGTLWNLSKTQEVQFKRNVMTTVSITLSPDLSGLHFDLIEEPLDDDNDIHMSINTDGLIDIDVNPQS